MYLYIIINIAGIWIDPEIFVPQMVVYSIVQGILDISPNIVTLNNWISSPDSSDCLYLSIFGAYSPPFNLYISNWESYFWMWSGLMSVRAANSDEFDA